MRSLGSINVVMMLRMRGSICLARLLGYGDPPGGNTCASWINHSVDVVVVVVVVVFLFTPSPFHQVKFYQSNRDRRGSLIDESSNVTVETPGRAAKDRLLPQQPCASWGQSGIASATSDADASKTTLIQEHSRLQESVAPRRRKGAPEERIRHLSGASLRLSAIRRAPPCGRRTSIPGCHFMESCDCCQCSAKR